MNRRTASADLAATHLHQAELDFAELDQEVNVPTLAALALAIVIFLVAASVSRIYATDGRLFIVVIAMVLYVIGNLLMVPIMRAVGLGVAISLATIAQLILINIVAFAFFHERPAPLHLAGILLGALSMALMLLPSGER